MAALRDLVIENESDIRDGIQSIIVWKTGRSWHMYVVYGDYDDRTGIYQFTDEESVIYARGILEKDQNAVMLNSYYDNLGNMEECSAQEIAEFIRWQYDIHGEKLAGILANATWEYPAD